MTADDCYAIQEYLAEKRDLVVELAKDGDHDAKTTIELHRMIVRKPDWPTWAMLSVVVERLKKRF